MVSGGSARRSVATVDSTSTTSKGQLQKKFWQRRDIGVFT